MKGPGLLVRVGLGLLLLTAAVGTPADADLWGHVTFGRDIIATGHVIQADAYAFTSDRPWVNHEWLSEVSFAEMYRLAGPAGLVALKLIVLAALFGLLWRHVRRLRPSASTAAAMLTLAFAGTFWRTHAVRPQLFSVLCFAIVLIAIARADAGRRRTLFVLPPLMALWVNFHGGWIVGLAILGVWTAVQVIDRRIKPSHRLTAALVGVAAVAATLLNPHGAQMWTFLGETVHLGRDDIEEWGSILTHPLALGLPWACVMTVAGLAFWRLPRARRLDYMAIVGLLAVLSFRVGRLDAFLALAVVILLAPELVSLFGAVERGMSGSVRPAPAATALAAAPPSFGVVAITVAAVAAMIVPAARIVGPHATCLTIAGPWVPEPGAAQFVAVNRLKGRMLTWFDWGEYAIWHFGPDLQVSMDGRRETVYSDRTLQAHRRFYAADDTAFSYLRALNPDYIWLPRHLPIVGRLADAGWVAAFSGPISVVFARQGAGPFTQPAEAPAAMRCFPGP